MCAKAEAWKHLRTGVASKSRTAVVQAYTGPVTLDMAVANFATAKAPNVMASDGGVTLVATLVAIVWLAIISDTHL